MHTFYVKELKEPSYKVVDQINSPKNKCENFNRSYLPNGKQVAIVPFEDQQQAISRLHLTDWKRPRFEYETEYEGEVYHLVRKRNEPGF